MRAEGDGEEDVGRLYDWYFDTSSVTLYSYDIMNMNPTAWSSQLIGWLNIAAALPSV